MSVKFNSMRDWEDNNTPQNPKDLGVLWWILYVITLALMIFGGFFVTN